MCKINKSLNKNICRKEVKMAKQLRILAVLEDLGSICDEMGEKKQ